MNRLLKIGWRIGFQEPFSLTFLMETAPGLKDIFVDLATGLFSLKVNGIVMETQVFTPCTCC